MKLLIPLDTPALSFKGGFCEYAISTKLPCVRQFAIFLMPNVLLIFNKAIFFLFLTGIRGDYELDVGPKVILVASGGTLELHGQEKLSWTKLNKTVTKVDNSEALLYDHMVRII